MLAQFKVVRKEGTWLILLSLGGDHKWTKPLEAEQKDHDFQHSTGSTVGPCLKSLKQNNKQTKNDFCETISNAGNKKSLGGRHKASIRLLA